MHTDTHNTNTVRLQPPDVCWQNCLRSLIGTFSFFPLSHSLSLTLSLTHFALCVCVCACVCECAHMYMSATLQGKKAWVFLCFHGKRTRAWVPLNETEAQATAHSVAMWLGEPTRLTKSWNESLNRTKRTPQTHAHTHTHKRTHGYTHKLFRCPGSFPAADNEEVWRCAFVCADLKHTLLMANWMVCTHCQSQTNFQSTKSAFCLL